MIPDPKAKQLFDRGNELYHAGDFEAASAHFQRSIRIEDHVGARLNLATALAANRQFSEAFLIYETIKQFPRANCDYGVVEAYAGLNYRCFFARWLDRFKCSDESITLLKNAAKIKPYGGENLDGKRLLFYCERACGDSIQLLRYVQAIKAKYDVHVTVTCRQTLKELFKRCPSVDRVFTTWDEIDRERFDFWLASFTAPLVFDDPGPTKFNVEPIELDLLGKKIGICWTGDPGHIENHWRHIPVELLRPLTECGTLINLQHDKTCQFAESFKINSFHYLAKLILACDVVVSIDTSVLHLAASLGVPTFALLAWKRAHWFPPSRDVCEWYPQMKLITQDKLNEWEPVIERVKSALYRSWTA